MSFGIVRLAMAECDNCKCERTGREEIGKGDLESYANVLGLEHWQRAALAVCQRAALAVAHEQPKWVPVKKCGTVNWPPHCWNSGFGVTLQPFCCSNWPLQQCLMVLFTLSS